jgi:hypothetical protein
MDISGRFTSDTQKTHTRTGSIFPPILRPNRDSDDPSRANHQHHHTIEHTENMTAHTAYRIWFNDFLSTEFFAEYHNLTLEKARKLIREGREIEEQIEKLKAQHITTQKENL